MAVTRDAFPSWKFPLLDFLDSWGFHIGNYIYYLTYSIVCGCLDLLTCENRCHFINSRVVCHSNLLTMETRQKQICASHNLLNQWWAYGREWMTTWLCNIWFETYLCRCCSKSVIHVSRTKAQHWICKLQIADTQSNEIPRKINHWLCSTLVDGWLKTLPG